MSVFLLLYFSVYGGANVYLLYRFSIAFRASGLKMLIPAAIVLLLVAAPLFLRALDRAGLSVLALAAALLSFTWMAVTMWLFSLSILLDLWNGLVRVAAAWRPAASAYAVAPLPGFLAISGVVVVLAICSFLNDRRLRLETVEIRTSRWPQGAPPLRLVQIADLHLGLISGQERLRQIVDTVAGAKPDVLVCTGDLMDATGAKMAELTPMLADVEAPLGKYAVIGNHAYYAGLDTGLEILSDCGFQVLRAASAQVDERLCIAGVDDRAGAEMGVECLLDEDAALPAAGPDRRFTVLLNHRPVVNPESQHRFDLQLSAHTHAGQIFPFNLLVAPYYPRLRGRYDLEGGAILYVSRGTGSWGPPMRLFAPREATLFIIGPETPDTPAPR